MRQVGATCPPYKFPKVQACIFRGVWTDLPAFGWLTHSTKGTKGTQKRNDAGSSNVQCRDRIRWKGLGEMCSGGVDQPPPLRTTPHLILNQGLAPSPFYKGSLTKHFPLQEPPTPLSRGSGNTSTHFALEREGLNTRKRQLFTPPKKKCMLFFGVSKCDFNPRCFKLDVVTPAPSPDFPQTSPNKIGPQCLAGSYMFVFEWAPKQCNLQIWTSPRILLGCTRRL